MIGFNNFGEVHLVFADLNCFDLEHRLPWSESNMFFFISMVFFMVVKHCFTSQIKCLMHGERLRQEKFYVKGFGSSFI